MGAKMALLLLSDFHALPVGQQSQLMGEARVCPGDCLVVDIPVEAVLRPEKAQALDHPLGGKIGVLQYRRGEKQTLDIVPPVKLDGQFRQLPGGEGGPGHVVGAAVDAVGAVIAAVVGVEHLQKGHTPPVGGEGVAAAGIGGGADGPGPSAPDHPAGGTGGVVFGGVGQDRQLVHDLHRNSP